MGEREQAPLSMLVATCFAAITLVCIVLLLINLSGDVQRIADALEAQTEAPVSVEAPSPSRPPSGPRVH